MAAKHVIFDFGQVLVRFVPAQLTAVYVTDPADRAEVEQAVFAREYWDKLDAGAITDDEVKHLFCAQLPARLHAVACRVFDGWIENLPPIDGVVAQVKALKARGVRLYLLSNISCRFASEWPHIPTLKELFSLFDGLVFSGPLGLVKPHPPIFAHLLNTYGLAAADCVFVDDNPDNIAGARAVGIDGYLFDGDVDALAQKLSTVCGD